jgi:hypothetical protein
MLINNFFKDSTPSSAKGPSVPARVFRLRPRRARDGDLEIQHVSGVFSGSKKMKSDEIGVNETWLSTFFVGKRGE